jgi:hypothetical protein
MASRVEYAVNITPIATIDAVSNQSAVHDVIELDIGKSLGASSSVAVGQTAHTTVGYAAGTVAYLEAVDDAKTQMGADNQAYDMVFIKHTGYSYSTATALGTTSISVALKVFIEYTGGSAWAHIASIPSGGALVLPSFPAQGASKGIFVQPASGTDHIAVEYALIT